MAHIQIKNYVNGSPITPGVTYKLGDADTHTAWLLASSSPCLFKLSATAPTDELWSNITPEQFIINGSVAGQVIEIESPDGKYFVVPTNAQDKNASVESAHATIALRPLGFDYDQEYQALPLDSDGPVSEGFYKISNLESGKLYSINVHPDLGGLMETKPNPEFSYALFSVGADNNPKAFLAGGKTTDQLVFVATETSAILSLGSTIEEADFFVSIRNFSLGSGFDPASDQNITGAWNFTNTAGLVLGNEVPLVLGQGENALKIHGTGAGEAVIEGGNATELDVAVPVNLQEPITVQDTLTVAGLATFSGHAKIKGHIGLGATDGSAEINFTPVAPNQLSVLGDEGAHVDIYTPPEASAGEPLKAEDKLLTQGECDARYVLFVQTTQVEYNGIDAKNPGTIYHTQDTGIFYIGDKRFTPLSTPLLDSSIVGYSDFASQTADFGTKKDSVDITTSGANLVLSGITFNGYGANNRDVMSVTMVLDLSKLDTPKAYTALFNAKGGSTSWGVGLNTDRTLKGLWDNAAYSGGPTTTALGEEGTLTISVVTGELGTRIYWGDSDTYRTSGGLKFSGANLTQILMDAGLADAVEQLYVHDSTLSQEQIGNLMAEVASVVYEYSSRTASTSVASVDYEDSSSNRQLNLDEAELMS